jgi:hypothetical protein
LTVAPPWFKIPEAHRKPEAGGLPPQAGIISPTGRAVSLKAFLLSAFVFPGLGQLYKHDQRKGILLILLGNLLLGTTLLVGVILFSQEYLAVYYPKPLTGDIIRSVLAAMCTSPMFVIPGGLLVALWTYAALDAGFRGPQRTPEA